jgi:hypothetical protein
MEGDVGEFTVWVDGRKVASKWLMFFPGERKIVKAVRAALQMSSQKV